MEIVITFSAIFLCLIVLAVAGVAAASLIEQFKDRRLDGDFLGAGVRALALAAIVAALFTGLAAVVSTTDDGCSESHPCVQMGER